MTTSSSSTQRRRRCGSGGPSAPAILPTVVEKFRDGQGGDGSAWEAPQWCGDERGWTQGLVFWFLMKNWSGTVPFIAIFSLLLVLDADSRSTRFPFWSKADPAEDKQKGRIFIHGDALSSDSVLASCWRWSLARLTWACWVAREAKAAGLVLGREEKKEIKETMDRLGFGPEA
jgi:hypothetical protein